MEKPEFKEKVGEILGKAILKDNKIYIEWSTGGMQGGNCWNDDEARPYASSESEPEFKDLDDVLTAVCPDIKFLQYKTISSLIKHDSRTEQEYYGNCTDYSSKSINLDELYDQLVKMGAI